MAHGRALDCREARTQESLACLYLYMRICSWNMRIIPNNGQKSFRKIRVPVKYDRRPTGSRAPCCEERR